MKIFSTAYFPPVIYFSELINSERTVIEQYENYVKQSYRNRCEILSPGGKQTLSIPVIKKSGQKQLIKDVKIDYKNNWQAQHLKSLQAAYLSSPFFEFYIDSLLPFFKKKFTFLFDLNLEILQTILNEMQIERKINLSEKFVPEYPDNDFRYIIHPKKDLSTNLKEYTQVFSEKYGFVPNLSILDLLFNEGPNTENFLIL